MSRVLEWLRPTCSVVVFWAIDLGGDTDGRDRPPSTRHAGESSSAVSVQSTDASPWPGSVRASTSRLLIQHLEPGVDSEKIVAVAQASDLTATEVARRLARGSRCVALLMNGEVATTCWVSEGAEWLGELEGWFVPGPGDAYVWDCATRPVFRGNHLYPYLLRQTLRRLSGERIRRVWIATEWNNWRSAQGVTRAGFRPVGAVVCIRLGQFRWLWVVPDPGAPIRMVSSLKNGLSPRVPTRQ